jgi:hypothetical protein
VLKIIILSIICLGVLGTGGYFGYQAAYANGKTAGYESGYSEGKDYGYSSGKLQGYEEGYQNGDKEGYSKGYDTGEQSGYDTGYTVGKDAGYSEGFSEGQIDGRENGYEYGYVQGATDALGHGYTLRDPTFAEAVAFMNQDHTSENEYDGSDYGIYVCSHYSRDTNYSAEIAGYRCALVELRYSDSGHTIVAFNTIDRGFVYFEPQSDELVVPEIGKRYYQCVIPEPGRYYPEPSYDDTIRDILIIW